MLKVIKFLNELLNNEDLNILSFHLTVALLKSVIRLVFVLFPGFLVDGLFDFANDQVSTPSKVIIGRICLVGWLCCPIVGLSWIVIKKLKGSATPFQLATSASLIANPYTVILALSTILLIVAMLLPFIINED